MSTSGAQARRPSAVAKAGPGEGGHDLRLAGPAAATWLTAFVLLGAPSWAAYATAATTGTFAVMLLRPRSPTSLGGILAPRGAKIPPNDGSAPRPWVAVGGAVLACIAAVAVAVGLRVSTVTSGPVRALAHEGGQTTFEAVVTGDPQTRRSQGRSFVLLRARAETVRWRGGLTRVRVPVLLLAAGPGWTAPVPGTRVGFTGRPVEPRHAELLAAVVLVRGPPTVLAGPPPHLRAAATVRERLRQAAEVLPPPQRGVLPGMVLGDTSRLDPALADDFKAAGLSHIMVVSGANLAVISGAVLKLTCRAGAADRRAAPLAAAAMLAFVLAARPDPSVLRAAVMGMVGLLALLTGRERQGIPALGAAVIGLVLVDPALARSYGFALSVLATAGLLLLAPRWRDRLCAHMPRWVAEALAVTAAAQVCCAPVLVMLSGQISLVSIGANLLAAPAVVPATLLGAVAAVVAPFALGPARLLLWPAGWCVGWIIGVAHSATGLPYATLAWRQGSLGALLLIAALAAVPLVRRRRFRRYGAALLTGAVLTLVAVRLLSPGWPPPGWRLIACDVGQGDALVLSTGPHQAVVVDTGPEPGAVDRCLGDLDVHAVPLLVLTHPHADHVGGVAGVRAGRAIGAVLTSVASEGLGTTALGGLRPVFDDPRQPWRAGSLTLSVLGPAPGTPRVAVDAPGTEVNNISVVLVARWPGLSVLLSGDVETEAQRALAAVVPPVDVLKVPHHGSARQDPAFLQASRARIAIISVGAGNDYGHPAPITLDLLRRYAMHVYRTDHHGDIAVTGTGSGRTVVTHRD